MSCLGGCESQDPGWLKILDLLSLKPVSKAEWQARLAHLKCQREKKDEKSALSTVNGENFKDLPTSPFKELKPKFRRDCLTFQKLAAVGLNAYSKCIGETKDQKSVLSTVNDENVMDPPTKSKRGRKKKIKVDIHIQPCLNSGVDDGPANQIPPSDKHSPQQQPSNVTTMYLSNACCETSSSGQSKSSFSDRCSVIHQRKLKSLPNDTNADVRFHKPKIPFNNRNDEDQAVVNDSKQISSSSAALKSRPHLKHDMKINAACKLCGHTFSHQDDLKRHMTIHVGDRRYACEVCGEAFNYPTNLKRHMRTHTGEKPFLCEICGKWFSRASNLKTHMMTHSGEKPFMCETCGKAFNQSSYLKAHMRSHTSGKPFMCETCDKAFNQSPHLKSHMRNHTGEKPFVCEMCGEAFNKTSNLKTHIRIHTGEKPFVCEMCNKAFTRASSLKTHIRSHTGEKPFGCEFCGKAFSQATNLKIHMRTHTGEKPFVCEVCGKEYRQLNHMKKHIRTHTF